MFAMKTAERPNTPVTPDLQGAGAAPGPAPDGLAGTVEGIRHQAAELAQRGVQAVRDSSEQLREKAAHAGDRTVGYIRDEPVKAMMIAAATGAALMALLGLLTRSRK
jgi:ElaB/YqjD/DUF883 family membrane-anchored ribosome-binding protein